MLHSLEALMKGGDNGPVIKPGELPGSRLYACLLLPVDDKQRMPPKGRKQLSAGQIDLIRLWIADGASPVRKLSELAPEDTVKQLLSSLVSETLSPDEQFGDPVPAVAPDKLDMLADSGILVTEISRTGGYLKAWVRAEREVVTEGNMESLSELTEQLVWISFANKQIAPEAFAKLGRFRNLRRLDLANTNITDHDVQHIKGLNQLTYLNLYGTSVSDEGLKAIRSLQALRRLFLWQTNTSPSGVDRLIKDIAGLSVDTGAAAFPR